MFSLIRLAIKPYMLSGIDCETLGIMLRRRRQNAKISVERTTARTINREELVKEMSMSPTLIGIIGLTTNCSIGFDMCYSCSFPCF